jgi:hypothetical protein
MEPKFAKAPWEMSFDVEGCISIYAIPEDQGKIEFIPIKPSVAMALDGLERYAAHRRLP